MPPRSHATICSRYCRSVRTLSALAIALLACNTKSDAPPVATGSGSASDAAAAAPKQEVELKSPALITIDRRIEIVSIVYRLAGFKEYSQAKPTPYITAVDAYFKPFAKHPAIDRAISLRNKYGIGHDAPMSLAIHLDDRFVPRPGAGEAMAAMDHRWKGVDIASFAALLADFVAVSKADDFLALHAGYHRQLVAAVRALVDAENPVGWFDSMFGPRRGARYVVVPSAIAGPANYGPTAREPSGTLEMYQILGIPTADGLPAKDPAVVELLVHEMAHAYINPVFDRYRDKLQSSGTQLFALVAPQMRRQAYTQWNIMTNEAGVRAMTALYLKDRKGDEAGARAARAEVRNGFVWTHELVELFRKYQRDRHTYPDFEAFMPRVIAFFDDTAKRYGGKLPPTPFLGPFDAVFDGQPMVIAAPVTDWETLAKYVQQIHAQLLATRGPLVPASAELLTAHPNKHVLAYGTPQSNPVIAHIAERASWKIESTGITLGKKHFPGATNVLIAVWYRPDDPTKGVAVYAASSDRLLPGINSLRHGDKDWLIARPDGKGNHTIVASGDWPQFSGAWVPPE